MFKCLAYVALLECAKSFHIYFLVIRTYVAFHVSAIRNLSIKSLPINFQPLASVRHTRSWPAGTIFCRYTTPMKYTLVK